jgi:hypothetical protein
MRKSFDYRYFKVSSRTIQEFRSVPDADDDRLGVSPDMEEAR